MGIREGKQVPANRQWGALWRSRGAVATGLLAFALGAQFLPRHVGGLVLFVVLVLPLVVVGHVGIALFRCPRCGERFAYSGRLMEDGLFALFRGYLGRRCASCGARIGQGDAD